MERLQIQRIAICRAKLSRLYEVEIARLEMRSNKLEHSTESIFKEMSYVEGVVEEEDELDILIKQSQEKYRKKQRVNQNTSVAPAADVEEVPADLTSLDVLEKCKVFVDLYRYSQEAQRAFEQFLQTKALMLKSVTLPSNQSDLLMRYQTTLERILSSAIGELLALQYQRPTK